MAGGIAFDAWSQTMRTPASSRPPTVSTGEKAGSTGSRLRRALPSIPDACCAVEARLWTINAIHAAESIAGGRESIRMSSLKRVAAPQGVLAPFAALVAGAVAMGVSPIFVRLADVGPFTSAFWRVTLALPLLYAWMRLADGQEGPPAKGSRGRRSSRGSLSPATSSSGTCRSSTPAWPTPLSLPRPPRSGSCCSAGSCSDRGRRQGSSQDLRSA